MRPTPALRFNVLEVVKLHGHERIRPSLLEQLTGEIRRDGCLKRPILVADGDLVVLDGHHRLEALKALGCQRIPVYLVDYFSDVVQLTTWPSATVRRVSKKEVIRRGLSSDPYPPKTTRHTLRVQLGERPIDLKDLR